MDVLQKILRLGLLALFLTLLIGISNLPHKPLLWAYIVLFVAGRAAELFHPATEALAEWQRTTPHPRWVTWLFGLTFITNVALPILDYRYRSQVFWTSPLPAVTLWSWLGALALLAGAAMRWQMFKEIPTPQQLATAKPASKRKRPTTEAAEIPKFEPGYLAHLHQQFARGAAMAYLGTAVLFTSLWGLLTLAIVVLPAMLYRYEGKEQTTPS